MNMKDIILAIENSQNKYVTGSYYISDDLAKYITKELGYLPNYLKVIGRKEENND